MVRAFLALALLTSPLSAAEPTVAELVKQLETGSPGERVIAAELLGERGPAGLAAAPALARVALRTKPEARDEKDDPRANADWHLYLACSYALRELGPKAAPEAATLFRHEFVVARYSAFPHFVKVATVPELLPCLSDSTWEFAEGAAHALGNMGPKAEPAIPDLVSLVVRPPKSPRQLWQGSMPEPRSAAARALVKIGPKGGAAITTELLPHLAAELKGGKESWDGNYLGAVLEALGDLGEPLAPVLVELARSAKDADAQSGHLWHLLNLGRAGEKAFAAFPRDAKLESWRGVLVALDKSHSASLAPFGAQILAGLRDADASGRHCAIRLVARLKGGHAGVVPVLTQLLGDAAYVRSLPERLSAADLVKPLLDGGDAGVKAAVGCLTSGDALVRAGAAEAFARRRTLARPHLDVFRKMARTDPDTNAAAWAAVVAAYVPLDPAELDAFAARKREGLPPRGFDLAREYLRPPPEIPPLRPTDDTVADVLKRVAADGWHEYAAMSLAAIGPPAKATVPELRKLLVAPSPRTRLAAAVALARIENDFPKYRADILRTVKYLRPNDADLVEDVFVLTAPELPELLPRMASEIREDRVYAAVRKYGPAATVCVPKWREEMAADFVWDREIRMAGDLGPVARAALPELRRLADGDRVELAVAARAAIKKIEGK